MIFTSVLLVTGIKLVGLWFLIPPLTARHSISPSPVITPEEPDFALPISQILFLSFIQALESISPDSSQLLTLLVLYYHCSCCFKFISFVNPFWKDEKIKVYSMVSIIWFSILS